MVKNVLEPQAPRFKEIMLISAEHEKSDANRSCNAETGLLLFSLSQLLYLLC